jgi:lysophospholipase L1-like esterase
MMRRVLAVLGVIAATAAAPAVAQTPTLTLTATADNPGQIDLSVTGGPPSATVTLTDTTDAPQRLGKLTLDATGAGTLTDATEWTCTRKRTFNAAGPAVSADAGVKTPSCAHRYRLAVAKRTTAGEPLKVRVTDTFHLTAAEAKVCLKDTCKRAPEDGHLTFTPATAGRYRIALRAPHQTTTTRVVRVKTRHISLLATGDSMMQILDDFLADRLSDQGVTTHKDANVSTGITKSFLLDWPAHAKEQVAKYHPDVTVMFLGANDGYGFGTIQCCGKAWVKQYAKRVNGMIHTYAQGHNAQVFWCLLPAPRTANFRKVFVGVNQAIRRAVRENPKTAHVVDLPKTFTPGYQFQQDVNGTSVRQDDGVHLNVAGASIAADIIRRQLHKHGAA